MPRIVSPDPRPTTVTEPVVAGVAESKNSSVLLGPRPTRGTAAAGEAATPRAMRAIRTARIAGS
jgi:hypothetical protein